MHVVFLRAANVAGHNAFKPAAVAKQLATLDVANLGAAGTFVVRAKATPAAVRQAFAEALPFEGEIFVCTGASVLALEQPESPPEARAFLTVFAGKPKKRPKLPLDAPTEGPWQMRLVSMQGPFALTLRRAEPGRFYPNDLVEKSLGVRGTTRGWPTVDRIQKLLEA